MDLTQAYRLKQIMDRNLSINLSHPMLACCFNLELHWQHCLSLNMSGDSFSLCQSALRRRRWCFDRASSLKFISTLIRQVCTKHILLSFPGLTGSVSCLWIFRGALNAMDICVRTVLPPPLSTMQLTRRHRMPFMSLSLFHSKLHCFMPLSHQHPCMRYVSI